MNNTIQELDYNSADSKEEVYFSWWLDELFKAGYVDSWDYHSGLFKLSEKVQYQVDVKLKTKTRTDNLILLRAHTYTPDFVIVWNEKSKGIFYNNIGDMVDLKKFPFIANDDISYADVKPAAWGHGDSFTQMFVVRQKWVYAKYKIYIQPIIVTGKKSALFESTFCPQRFLLTDKSGKARKLKLDPVMVDEFLNGK